MRSYLEQQVAERDSKIADIDGRLAALQQERIVASAERSAYLDALQHVRDEKPTRQGGRSGLRSGAWREVFRLIATSWPNAVSNDQMMAHIVGNGLRLNRQSLRAQLSAYTQNGDLERVDEGLYKITPQGAFKLEMPLESALEGMPADSPQEATGDPAASPSW